MLIPLLFPLFWGVVTSQSVKKVHLGFPETWDGDKYQELYCPSKNIPKFLGKNLKYVLIIKRLFKI